MHNNTLDLLQEGKQLQKSSSIKNKNGYFQNSEHNIHLILFRMFLWFQWRFQKMRHVSFAIQERLFENPEW